jgi:hypothetical protein
MFLRMLSYYISWHMKQARPQSLFVGNDKPAAARRTNPVGPAQRSNDALAKTARKRTTDDDNTPVHGFTSLLANLATICANQIQPADDMPAFTKVTTRHPTPAARLRTARRRRFILPRLHVVITHTRKDHKTPG